MKPQICDATTEVDARADHESFPGAETFMNQQEVPQEVPQENSEKHPDNMFKVITYTRNKSQDAEFDGTTDDYDSTTTSTNSSSNTCRFGTAFLSHLISRLHNDVFLLCRVCLLLYEVPLEIHRQTQIR